MLWAFMIVGITFVVIIIMERYHYVQRRKIRKYDLYKLRDEVIWEIASNKPSKKLIESYGRINATIKNLHRFNFRSFANVLKDGIDDSLEASYQELSGKAASSKEREINNYNIALIHEVLKAARKNSLLLRLAMTRFGYLVLFTCFSVTGIAKLFARHPDLWTKLTTMKEYSSLAKNERAINDKAPKRMAA